MWLTVKRCSGNFSGTIKQNDKHPHPLFFEKAALKVFRKFLENFLWQRAHWKPVTMLNMSSVAHVFLRSSRKFQNICFIKQHLWLCAFDKATLKKNLVEVNHPQKWPGKQNGTTVAAVMILEVVNNWRSVLRINILKNKLNFES